MRGGTKMSTFTKDDLKIGYLVVLRGGKEVVVFKDYASVYLQDNYSESFVQDCCVDLNKNNSWFRLEGYTNYLNYLDYSEYDIMEVYLQSHPYSFVSEYEKDKRVLIWKREEKSEKDLKIEELSATIKKAQEQINKLKGMK
jgi:hypothetical protein